jgi:hypothetical protein
MTLSSTCTRSGENATAMVTDTLVVEEGKGPAVEVGSTLHPAGRV